MDRGIDWRGRAHALDLGGRAGQLLGKRGHVGLLLRSQQWQGNKQRNQG